MKLKVALVFGGKSAEHEVSLTSATNIYHSIDKNLFDVVLLGSGKDGKWYYNPSYNTTDLNLVKDDYYQGAVNVIIDSNDGKHAILSRENATTLNTFDIVFSIVHGTYGEDGSLQGFFRTLDIPYVGPNILGSSVCMDKDIAKRLFADAGIPIAKFITYRRDDEVIGFSKVKEMLGLPMFVKPCNAGSSVGVSKVTDEKEYYNAIKTAFKYDTKILVEESVAGKEVECAILGNEHPSASIVGEIIPTKDFYSYEAKYQDDTAANLRIPADIPEEVSNQIRTFAVKGFIATGCEGLARVDFLMRPDHSFVLNEINTLPGFTSISMYPKLWERTGINHIDLITRLINLGLERHKRDNNIVTSR